MQSIIELPNEFKVLIASVLTVIVTQVLKFLGEKIDFDLSGYTAQVVAGLVAAALVVINGALSHVPAGFEPLVSQVIGLVLIVLASFGAYKVFLSPKSK